MILPRSHFGLFVCTQLPPYITVSHLENTALQMRRELDMLENGQMKTLKSEVAPQSLKVSQWLGRKEK